MKKNVFAYILVCASLSNDGVGVARGTAFQETGCTAGSWF